MFPEVKKRKIGTLRCNHPLICVSFSAPNLLIAVYLKKIPAVRPELTQMGYFYAI